MSQGYKPLALLSSTAKVGLGLGVVPFFFSIGSSTSRTSTVNGVVVESAETSTNLVGIGAGAVAVACALLVVKDALATRGDPSKPKRVALAAGIAALGVYQLVRGLGLI